MTAFSPSQIEWLAELDSTNAELKRRLLSATPPPSGTVIATLAQTAGRGRAGRVWSSGRGKNLCLSFFLASAAGPMLIPSLGMACALAVDDLLRSLGIASRPKWPNDVRVAERKIAGILSEGIPRCGAIVGIGVNVNMSRSDADAIDQAATSILIETGRAHSPQELAQQLLSQLSARCTAWRAAGFAGLRADWCARAEGFGDEVEVRADSGTIRGVLDDFGPYGECRLRLPDGEIRDIWSGDIRSPI